MSTEIHSDLMVIVESMTPSTTKPQRQTYYPASFMQAVAIYQEAARKPFTRKIEIYTRTLVWSRT